MQTVAYRQDTHHFTFTILTSSEVRALNSYDATTPVRNTILSNHNAVGKLMLVWWMVGGDSTVLLRQNRSYRAFKAINYFDKNILPKVTMLRDLRAHNKNGWSHLSIIDLFSFQAQWNVHVKRGSDKYRAIKLTEIGHKLMKWDNMGDGNSPIAVLKCWLAKSVSSWIFLSMLNSPKSISGLFKTWLHVWSNFNT